MLRKEVTTEKFSEARRNSGAPHPAIFDRKDGRSDQGPRLENSQSEGSPRDI